MRMRGGNLAGSEDWPAVEHNVTTVNVSAGTLVGSASCSAVLGQARGGAGKVVGGRLLCYELTPILPGSGTIKYRRSQWSAI